jgi:hypothetical protein
VDDSIRLSVTEVVLTEQEEPNNGSVVLEAGAEGIGQRVPPQGSTGGALLVAVATAESDNDPHADSAGHSNMFGWCDGEAQRAKIWAVYDEQFQDYLDDIRMAGEGAGDVLREPPRRPLGPRLRQ